MLGSSQVIFPHIIIGISSFYAIFVVVEQSFSAQSADRHVVPFMEGIVLSYVFILMAVELAIWYLFTRLTGENKRGASSF